MSSDVAPALRLALREYRIYINQAVLSCLSHPTYLQFLFQDERKLLVISGSAERVKNSFNVPDKVYKDSGEECCISRMALTEAFRLRMGWDKDENYRVTGEFSSNIGMVVFDLSKATIVG